MITLASVEVNDEYRVGLVQLSKRLDLSPDQAEALGIDLITAAHNARELLEADLLARLESMIDSPVTDGGEAVL